MAILFLIGFVHIMKAPILTAIKDNLIIGLMIFFLSIKFIQGALFIGEKIVDIENRME
jgi:hypothetical protein